MFLIHQSCCFKSAFYTRVTAELTTDRLTPHGKASAPAWHSEWHLELVLSGALPRFSRLPSFHVTLPCLPNLQTHPSLIALCESLKKQCLMFAFQTLNTFK